MALYAKASTEQRLELIEVLLDAGAAVNAADVYGSTVLMDACEVGLACNVPAPHLANHFMPCIMKIQYPGTSSRHSNVA